MSVSGVDAKRADVGTKVELKLIEDTNGPIASPVAQVFTTSQPFASHFFVGGRDGSKEGLYRVRAPAFTDKLGREIPVRDPFPPMLRGEGPDPDPTQDDP